MVKFVYCVRRHPSLSPAEFRKYWLEKHGPLVRQYAHAIHAKRYVQSHTIDTPINAIVQKMRGCAQPYDGITELWFESWADLALLAASPAALEANRILAEDEARFCDLSASSIFFTEEHTIFE